MSEKKHFVFDFDDTISSSYEFNQDMFVETFTPHLPDVDQSVLRRIHRTNRGAGMEMQFKMAVDELTLDLDPKELVKENEQLHLQNFHRITIFKSVHELFGRLNDRGKKVHICTNRQYQSLNAIIDGQGLRQYLTDIISCKDEGFEKPDPTCLLDLMRHNGGNKDDYIYFGDSKTDYEFASNAGIDFIIVDHYINEKNFYHMIVSAFL